MQTVAQAAPCIQIVIHSHLPSRLHYLSGCIHYITVRLDMHRLWGRIGLGLRLKK